MVIAFRSVVFLIIVSILCVGLAGCESGFFAGPVSIQQDSASMRVAVCEDLQILQIVAKERQPGIFGRWVTFWEAKGNRAVHSGETFTVGAPPDWLIESVSNTPDIGPRDELSITIFDQNGAVVVDAVFAVGLNGLPSDSWLQSDGEITKSPCV